MKCEGLGCIVQARNCQIKGNHPCPKTCQRLGSCRQTLHSNACRNACHVQIIDSGIDRWRCLELKYSRLMSLLLCELALEAKPCIPLILAGPLNSGQEYEQLILLAQRSRRYFPSGSASEIWQLCRPMLFDTNHPDAFQVLLSASKPCRIPTQ